MSQNKIIEIKPLGFPWDTQDPFLFCAHHADAYPKGNENMGPEPQLLRGRNIGQDFTIKDGWRMYHGDSIPGFPAHPHRGFETITIVKEGIVDHADSLGAAGRYGAGDVQWMTAGKGVQHSEMFPLLKQDAENPLELFQVWLNLSRANKFTEPYFGMMWADTIPVLKEKDATGKAIEIDIIAGSLKGIQAPKPGPSSWAANPDNEVAVWIIKMQAGAKWQLPAAKNNVNRTLYFYKGSGLSIENNAIPEYHSVQLLPKENVMLQCADQDCYILMLQGKPMKEPVAKYGPFVMNTHEELHQAMQDYQNTQFGGWPWSRSDHVHASVKGRFARYADGREEIKS
jgi:quercetin 2,3-dioxygenase